MVPMLPSRVITSRNSARLRSLARSANKRFDYRGGDGVAAERAEGQQKRAPFEEGVLVYELDGQNL